MRDENNTQMRNKDNDIFETKSHHVKRICYSLMEMKEIDSGLKL